MSRPTNKIRINNKKIAKKTTESQMGKFPVEINPLPRTSTDYGLTQRVGFRPTYEGERYNFAVPQTRGSFLRYNIRNDNDWYWIPFRFL